MRTKIQINGLRLRGFHGVEKQERRVGNIFVYDVEVVYPWIEAAKNDDVELTLNYATVVEVVKRANGAPSYLLEHIANRIMTSLTAIFPEIEGGRIRVSKLTPPIAGAEMDSASVVIEW